MSYDSTEDTRAHKVNVSHLLSDVCYQLIERSIRHDDTKLSDPEKSVFDEVTPKLKTTTYGSDEYFDTLKDMEIALTHHYANNTHHPEHFDNGIAGMSLLDLIEMLADWKAAGMRHSDGSLQDSLAFNEKRFGVSGQLASIFRNTVVELGW